MAGCGQRAWAANFITFADRGVAAGTIVALARALRYQALVT